MRKSLLLALCLLLAVGLVSAALLPTPLVAAAEGEASDDKAESGASGRVVPAIIPVEKQVEGEYNGESFEFLLTALDGAPLPEGAEGDSYTLEMQSAGTLNFPDMEYPYPQVYNYRVTEVPGKTTEARYDNSVYLVKVQVLVNEDTDEWYSLVTIRLEGDETKLDVCRFVNIYYRTGIVNQVGDSFE